VRDGAQKNIGTLDWYQPTYPPDHHPGGRETQLAPGLFATRYGLRIVESIWHHVKSFRANPGSPEFIGKLPRNGDYRVETTQQCQLNHLV
jgi:hypothetical protein